MQVLHKIIDRDSFAKQAKSSTTAAALRPCTQVLWNAILSQMATERPPTTHGLRRGSLELHLLDDGTNVDSAMEAGVVAAVRWACLCCSKRGNGANHLWWAAGFAQLGSGADDTLLHGHEYLSAIAMHCRQHSSQPRTGQQLQ